jgi:hypothetical protein
VSWGHEAYGIPEHRKPKISSTEKYSLFFVNNKETDENNDHNKTGQYDTKQRP